MGSPAFQYSSLSLSLSSHVLLLLARGIPETGGICEKSRATEDICTQEKEGKKWMKKLHNKELHNLYSSASGG
jgi:hypothetical protein